MFLLYDADACKILFWNDKDDDYDDKKRNCNGNRRM